MEGDLDQLRKARRHDEGPVVLEGPELQLPTFIGLGSGPGAADLLSAARG